MNGAFTMGVGNVYSEANAGANTALNVSGNGSLVVNSGTNNLLVGVGRSNTPSGNDPVATMDLSANGGLSSFSFNATSGQLQVGGGNLRSTLTLANLSNTITAATINVGNSNVNGAGNNNGGRSVMHNANTILLGEGKSGGILDFATGATAGTLVITGEAGGSSVANIQLGSSSSATGGNDDSELLLAGHNVNVQAGNVVVGRLAGATGGNSARGITTFDTGTFNISSLQLAVNSSGSATNGATGTFTLGGPTAGNTAATGILNVTTQFYLANRTNTTVAAGKSSGSFIINGGVANITTDILDASTTSSTNFANVTTLTLDGGTLNMNGRGIGAYAAPITTINLNSGTFNGAATIAARTINLQSAVVVNGTPAYILADGGTLNSALTTLTLPSGGAIGGGGTTTGTISGNVLAGAGSRIAPGFGTSAGTLTFNNDLTLSGNSTLAFKLGTTTTPGGGVNDLLNVNGALNFTGTATVAISGTGGGPVPGTYRLINYSNPATPISGTNLAVFGQTRQTFTLDTATAGQVNLTIGASTGPLSLIWTGASSAKWNLGIDPNWVNPTPAPDRFFAQDAVTFDDSSTNPSPVELVGALPPGSVTVNAARNYTFTGAGAITGSTKLTKSSTGTLVLANTGVNDYAGGTVNNTGGTLQVGAGGTSGNLPATGAVTNSGTLAFNRSDASTFGGAVSGTGDVKILGGTLTLTGAGTYTGPTLVTNGATVKVGLATGPTGGTSPLGAVPGAAVTIYSGSTLDLTPNAGANTTNFGQKQFFIEGTGVGALGVIVNSGASQQLAFEKITLTNDATIGGTQRYDIRETNGANISTLDLQGFSVESTTVMGGTNTVTYNDGTTAQFFSNTATPSTITRPMILNGAVRMGSNSTGNNTVVGSNILLNGGVTVGISNNVTSVFTLTGTISETGGARTLTKTGLSVLNLNGANTYTGATTISGGTVNATLLVNGGLPSSIGQATSAPANLVLNGGLLGYTGTNPASTDRQFTISGTASGLDASGASGAPVTFSSTAPITVSGGAATLNLSGSNTDDNVLAAQIVNGAAPTALTKTGASLWTLPNTNTYTGITTLSGGTLRVNVLANGGAASGIGQSAAAPGNLVLAGGTLSYTGAVAASTDRQFTVGVGGGGLDASGAAGAPVTFSSTAPFAISGNQSLAFKLGGSNTDRNVFAVQIVDGSSQTSLSKSGAGSWTLTNANTYTGQTTIDGGTLRVTGSISTSDVNVNSGGKFDAAAGQTVKTLSVQSGGIVVVSGPARIALAVGDHTNTSPLQSNGGKIDLTTNGLIIHHDPGAGDQPLNDLRTLIIAGFNPSQPGGIDGNWQGNGIYSSAITPGGGTAIGYAKASELPSSAGGKFFGQVVDASVVARYTLAGDATLDGAVDFNDLVKLAQNYNTSVSATTPSWWFNGDFNYDGIVDFNDLVKLAQNYNTSLPSEPIPGASAGFEQDLARAFASVPEPGAIGLLGGLAGAALMTRRQRRR